MKEELETYRHPTVLATEQAPGAPGAPGALAASAANAAVIAPPSPADVQGTVAPPAGASAADAPGWRARNWYQK